MIAAITIEGIVERLVSTGIVAIIVGLGTIALVKQQLKQLVRRLDGLEQADRRREAEISACGAERQECELRATRELATRAEVYRVSVDQTAMQQQILSRIDEMARDDEARTGKVHERINKINNDLSRMRGKLEGPSK